MIDPPNDLLVTMAKMEAYILDFLMFSSKIVTSSADFSRLFLFHSFRLGQPLCRLVELSMLQLAASRALRIFVINNKKKINKLKQNYNKHGAEETKRKYEGEEIEEEEYEEDQTKDKPITEPRVLRSVARAKKEVRFDQITEPFFSGYVP